MTNGEILLNESMARHSTFRAGGYAERFFSPKNIEDLQRFIKDELSDRKVYWVGYGSNILVRDGGFPGVIISLAGTCDDMELSESNLIRIGAGAASAHCARFAASNDLCGMEFLAGIPGTVGGALAMNAGAHGSETWDFVEEVCTINRLGEIRCRNRNEFKPSYRSVDIENDEWFITAKFRLEACKPGASKEKIDDLLKKRKETQPTTQPNCGSVFVNPAGDYAARLIETAGLKGDCINSACVSKKHANFIVNTGSATALDIERLIERIQQRVKAVHGVMLKTELKIIGKSSGGQCGNV